MNTIFNWLKDDGWMYVILGMCVTAQLGCLVAMYLAWGFPWSA